MNKRRKGYPSETNVKRGIRVVHGDKELTEKLGRNDLCPCGSGKRFKNAAATAAGFDGANRDYYFQGMILMSPQRLMPPWLALRARIFRTTRAARWRPL